MQKIGKYCFLLLFCGLLLMTPFTVLSYGEWKEVAVTPQKDYWYVDQVLSFSSKGSIKSARAFVKFVPGRESIIAQNIKKDLLSDGAKADRFDYFVEYVELDCTKKQFAISGIQFYDSEDVVMWEEKFLKPKQYIAIPGSVFEIIAQDLCLNKSGVFDIVKDIFKNK
ncbi:MAG: hypothetical protein C0399_11335 [Syntrophus sp. (in: bacteria)]|nr:hypothetical protein [Syntrophus sp. (in: bacteria)]